VALNVWNGPVPALFANPAAISLTASPFSAPVADAADICTSTGYARVRQAARASTSNGSNWLGVNVTTDVTSSCSIRLSVDPSHLDAGVYQDTVTIYVPGQALDGPVTLTISPPVSLTGGQPVLGSVLNSASDIQGAIAPGEIISIRGFGLSIGVNSVGTTFPLHSSSHVPTDLAGTEVLINGKPAPVLYVSPSQVYAIVRMKSRARAQLRFQVLFNGLSQVWSIPVASAAPGIFTLDATGEGAGSGPQSGQLGERYDAAWRARLGDSDIRHRQTGSRGSHRQRHASAGS
jgi:hypothetical protein